MGAGGRFSQGKPGMIFNHISEHPNIGLGRNALDNDLVGKTEHAWAKTIFWLSVMGFAVGDRLGASIFTSIRNRVGDSVHSWQINVDVCAIHISSADLLAVNRIFMRSVSFRLYLRFGLTCCVFLHIGGVNLFTPLSLFLWLSIAKHRLKSVEKVLQIVYSQSVLYYNLFFGGDANYNRQYCEYGGSVA
jgi:hypothetical protein